MIVDSEFRPSWWLSNPHLQTILASKVCKPDSVPTKSERIELDDGDFIDVNFSIEQDGDLVAIFHGLAGCVQSSYVQGAFAALQSTGFSPALMHWRGCSGEPNRLARSYHSGVSDEIDWFIKHLSERFPGRPIHALGYSLGANALLKYLGETGASCPLKSAVAVCPPLVLSEGATQLNTGVARNYQRYLLKLLRGQSERKRQLYPELGIPKASSELDSFWKFDDAITATVHGFEGVNDYYKKCSARQFIPSIAIKTHILCSRDDPFFTPAIIPTSDELPENVTLEVSSHGGHVGFLGRHPNNRFRTHRWLDDHVAQLLSSSIGL